MSQRHTPSTVEAYLRIAGIAQSRVKFSTQNNDVRPHYVGSTVKLVVMLDPAIPDFSGEIVTSTTIHLLTTVQSAARKMIKRIIARFWDTKFKDTIFRLIRRSIFITEDASPAFEARARAPHHE
jgi:hypothetical protein